MHWIFNLYDINGDGFVTKHEMLVIAKAIFDMLGGSTRPAVDTYTVQDRIDSIFYQMDTNQDGVITFDEFSDWCQRDDNRSNNLLMFDTVFL
ncbi:calsenilin-like protein [Leptotrombidium deliense]|uniref:Calsenilin-like protein n=1 Tax=Leptotrombidium deliense TaxID=299467 RepID=A0A443SCC6_9ACAR|nr:calsenilin-like protein [Leptotrombidium deliense]